ncbi:unnamed protein product [Rangifer tarandus platyrhynchus]|uniref:Uncharacterized protein n=1 Tax=Rangifer tarandus platyrhynchus TaxID=3082113 RepID=A0AC59Z6M5_RANTA
MGDHWLALRRPQGSPRVFPSWSFQWPQSWSLCLLEAQEPEFPTIQSSARLKAPPEAATALLLCSGALTPHSGYPGLQSQAPRGPPCFPRKSTPAWGNVPAALRAGPAPAGWCVTSLAPTPTLGAHPHHPSAQPSNRHRVCPDRAG